MAHTPSMKTYPRSTETQFTDVRDALTAIAAPTNTATHPHVRSDIASLLAHAENLVNGTTENDVHELEDFITRLQALARHEHMIAADRTNLNAKIAAFKTKYFNAPR